MSLRSTLWISVVALGGLIFPVSAVTEETASTPPTPATVTRTFVFPPIGVGQTENARIDVLNIAQAGHNGAAASCTGTISFSNDSGAGIGNATQFKNLGTHQIAHADLMGIAPGSPARNEYQGTVTVTYDPKAFAPCSLLLTLAVYDPTTGVTHGFVTAAVDLPTQIVPFGR